MKNILKKYYKLSDEEREKLEDFYIVDSILNTMADTTIYINPKSLETLVDIVKELLVYANIPLGELIDRIFKIIDAPDKSIDDIEELELEELIELLKEDENDFDDSYIEVEIIKEFEYKGYKCSLSKSGDKYVIIYEKDDKADVMIFNDYEDMLCSLIDYNMLREEHDIR